MTNYSDRHPKGQGDDALQHLIFKPGTGGLASQTINPSSFSRPSNPATTSQVQNRYGVPSQILRNCSMGTIVAWNAYLIWHQGRNRWKVYAEK